MIIILPSSSVINQVCLLLHPVNTQYQNLSDLHLYSQSFDKTETNQMDMRIAFIFVSFLMTLVRQILVRYEGGSIGRSLHEL